jgi:hypothetical protein
VSPVLKTKIEAFAKPPVILCFSTRKEAIDFLTAPPAPKAETPHPLSPLPSGASGPPPGVTSEPSQLDELRTRLQQLEAENKALQEQVVLATIARRPPQNEQVYDEKIAFLESKIEKLVTEAAAAASPVAAKKT